MYILDTVQNIQSSLPSTDPAAPEQFQMYDRPDPFRSFPSTRSLNNCNLISTTSTISTMQTAVDDLKGWVDFDAPRIHPENPEEQLRRIVSFLEKCGDGQFVRVYLSDGKGLVVVYTSHINSH